MQEVEKVIDNLVVEKSKYGCSTYSVVQDQAWASSELFINMVQIFTS